eukprot:COSAG05_NODE_11626_length_504_cov_1.513580_1_plen_83_part_00
MSRYISNSHVCEIHDVVVQPTLHLATPLYRLYEIYSPPWAGSNWSAGPEFAQTALGQRLRQPEEFASILKIRRQNNYKLYCY